MRVNICTTYLHLYHHISSGRYVVRNLKNLKFSQSSHHLKQNKLLPLCVTMNLLQKNDENLLSP